ncbi:hypothetical protein L195_g006616 [Trifolium pratense]|uniref:UVR domain-containing protein n=2 Tax=Trifolium pratense TaxID=57577 RepID=A0A2K3P454_TRIPR|nr:hypothetical protein L195_g006616 [Trifolium pratense]CAJ2633245.1 unnamed protein product [Trifolium pratense]
MRANSFQKLHHVCLPSFTPPTRLVLGKSWGKGDIKLHRRLERRQGAIGNEDLEECILSSENVVDENTLEKQLESAISKENYSKATEIRDTLKYLQETTFFGVMSINNRFYDHSGRVVSNVSSVDQKGDMCCVHPGARGVFGYHDVVES